MGASVVPAFRRFLEAAPDAMIAVEPDGGIAFADDTAERLFGFDGGDLLRAVRVVLDTGRLAR